MNSVLVTILLRPMIARRRDLLSADALNSGSYSGDCQRPAQSSAERVCPASLRRRAVIYYRDCGKLCQRVSLERRLDPGRQGDRENFIDLIRVAVDSVAGVSACAATACQNVGAALTFHNVDT